MADNNVIEIDCAKVGSIRYGSEFNAALAKLAADPTKPYIISLKSSAGDVTDPKVVRTIIENLNKHNNVQILDVTQCAFKAKNGMLQELSAFIAKNIEDRPLIKPLIIEKPSDPLKSRIGIVKFIGKLTAENSILLPALLQQCFPEQTTLDGKKYHQDMQGLDLSGCPIELNDNVRKFLLSVKPKLLKLARENSTQEFMQTNIDFIGDVFKNLMQKNSVERLQDAVEFDSNYDWRAFLQAMETKLADEIAVEQAQAAPLQVDPAVLPPLPPDNDDNTVGSSANQRQRAATAPTAAKQSPAQTTKPRSLSAGNNSSGVVREFNMIPYLSEYHHLPGTSYDVGVLMKQNVSSYQSINKFRAYHANSYAAFYTDIMKKFQENRSENELVHPFWEMAKMALWGLGRTVRPILNIPAMVLHPKNILSYLRNEVKSWFDFVKIMATLPDLIGDIYANNHPKNKSFDDSVANPYFHQFQKAPLLQKGVFALEQFVMQIVAVPFKVANAAIALTKFGLFMVPGVALLAEKLGFIPEKIQKSAFVLDYGVKKTLKETLATWAKKAVEFGTNYINEVKETGKEAIDAIQDCVLAGPHILSRIFNKRCPSLIYHQPKLNIQEKSDLKTAAANAAAELAALGGGASQLTSAAPGHTQTPLPKLPPLPVKAKAETTSALPADPSITVAPPPPPLPPLPTSPRSSSAPPP